MVDGTPLYTLVPVSRRSGDAHGHGEQSRRARYAAKSDRHSKYTPTTLAPGISATDR